ncbi:hypothetical protein PHISP_06625 [Aspergillus sp. HF37]|nr:hypothetical protein PHISP_06625 [Aspergillus sp. HF37]
MANGYGHGHDTSDAPQPQTVGVIIGAVFLFGTISLIPMYPSLLKLWLNMNCLADMYPVRVIMWYNRRFPRHPPPEPGRPPRSVELRSLSVHGFVRHVSVEQWLREKDEGQGQGHSEGPGQQRPSSAEHDAHDICPICLSPLVHTAVANMSYPEPALISLHRRPSGEPSVETGHCHSNECPGHDRILVLSRCNHSFHPACLAAWFEYRRYKCPMCQAPYFPEEP